MLGITFGSKHSYNDWGVILENTSVTPPMPKRYLVDVPARNGTLDLTAELTPTMRYGSRQITYTFRVKAGGWDDLMSTIYGDVHGKTLDVVSDLDPSWHWHGCVMVDSFESNQRTGILVILVEVDPFKLANSASVYTKSGSGAITCSVDRMEVNPTITVTTASTITFGDISVALDAGSHIVNAIVFTSGTNTLTVAGTGTTTVTYTNGRL